MKKLFTLFALGTITLGAAAQPSFDNYITDPASGTPQTELSVITVTFSDCNEIEVNNSESIILYDPNFEEVPGTAKAAYETNVLTFTLTSPVTKGGEYNLVIGDGALAGYDSDNNTVDNSEIVIPFTIEGGTESTLNFDDFTSEPAQGTVESLKTIALTFPNIYEVNVNSASGITLTHNDAPVSIGKIDEGEKLTFNLTDEQTAPGTYVLTIAKEAICGFSEDYNSYLDNPEQIVLTWKIANAADAVDFSYTVTPASGSTTASLSQLTMDFAGLDEIKLTEGGLMSVTAGGEPLAITAYGVSPGEKANQLLVVFSPAIEAENEDVAVVVNFPAGSLTGKKADKSGTNSAAATLNYTVAPKVVYDLTPALSSPTKPNADGEISADKQLDAFFFAIEQPGLTAAESTETNVTIREINGDFQASARLGKAQGLSQNTSYFSAAFGRQPQYNGEYEITIEQGALGDERWNADHHIGHSNKTVTLKFTLVDGKDYVEYNLMPSEVTPAEGTYVTGSEFATITVKFSESGVVLSEAEMLYANLASTGSDYNESAPFTANPDGSFSATFVAPTSDGTYRFTALAGAFCLDSRRNPEFQREFILDKNASAAEIEIDNTDGLQIYNLQGMPVKGKLPAGIYIINGKKVRM